MQEKFHLTWDNFPHAPRRVLKRLFRNEEFCDMTIVCEADKQIKAHKIILSSSSRFFERILRRNPHPNPLIYLIGLRVRDLEALLEFIYYGEVYVPLDHLETFMHAAKRLEIDGLENYENKSKSSVPVKSKDCCRNVASEKDSQDEKNNKVEIQDSDSLSSISSDKVISHNDVQFNNMTPSKKVSFDMKVVVSEFERETDSSFDVSTCSLESSTDEEGGTVEKNTAPPEVEHSVELDMKFFCDQCDREFTITENLERHMKLVHQKVTEII